MKNIVVLSSSKNVSGLFGNGQTYSDIALSNLFGEKFITIEKILPTLDWTAMPTDEIPTEFFISIDDTKKVLLSIKRHLPPGSDETPAWFHCENDSSLCHPLSSILNASSCESFVPSLYIRYSCSEGFP